MAQSPLQPSSFKKLPASGDSEKAFYNQRNPQHIPRYIFSRESSRAVIIIAVLLLCLCFAHLQPLSAQRVLRMSDPVVNARPHRSDIIKVQSLDPKLLPGKRRHDKEDRRLVIVGDVHGCKDELDSLLKKVHFRHSHDHLILAGDMINKGPSSHGVISLARSLGASAVRGNHEDKVLRAYASLDQSSAPPASPENNSATAKLARELSRHDIAWLAERPAILSVGAIPGLPYGNVAVVHAGLVPKVPLEEQDPFYVMNMRSIKVEHKSMRPSEYRDDGEKWWKVWNDVQHDLPHSERILVVYGHDSKQGLVEREYTVGLDSGCVKGGRLSALVIGGKPMMRVESVKCADYT